MISCLILDDEEYAVDVLKRLVQKTSFLNLLYATTDPIEAMEKLDEFPIDLVFLDMHIGALNGIEFLKASKGKAHFILCTAYSKYALESYEYNVIDYLLKPILYPRFLDAVHKASERITQVKNQSEDGNKFLFIKEVNKNQNIRLEYADILYLECVKNYIWLYTASERYMLRGTMKELEASLPLGVFIRVHASFIVSIKKIRAYDNTGLFLKGLEIKIPISQSYKESVLKVLLG